MKKYCVLPIFLLVAFISQAQNAIEDSWITDGYVNQIVPSGGKVLLAGEFNWFGPAYYGGSMAFNTNLAEDETFPKIEEEVLAAILDDAGGWYLAVRDRDQPYHGLPLYESKIIHIHADKTIEELPVTLSGTYTIISALVKSGNILYFGGYFQTVNGTTRNSAAAINLTNNTLTSWNPNVDVNGGINALTVSGGTVYAGGSFTNIGGQPRTFVAALDATTGLATSWNVTITGNSLAEVNTILVNAGIVYIGGYFQNVNAAASARTNFAAVNAATAALETFNPRPDGRVKTLLLDGAMLYMAGGFDRVFNTVRFRVARIELATSTLTPFELMFFSNTHSNFYGYDQVNAIGIDGNTLFIGGTFPWVNDVKQPYLAAVNKTTGVVESTDDKKIYGDINTLLVSGGNIFVGGYITGHLGEVVNGVAVLDEETGAGMYGLTNQIPDPPEDEYYQKFDFHSQNGRMYYYLNVSDGTTRIGALDEDDGSIISSFSVTINRHIGGWTFSNDAIYLATEGADAMTINGQSRERFAAVSLETGSLLPYTINFPLGLDEHTITSLALQNNSLYVAGDFTFTSNGTTRNNYSAFDATTGALLTWDPPAAEFGDSFEPKIAAITSSRIYLIGNSSRARRVHPTTGAVDQTWLPSNEGIEYIAAQGNSVFMIGGYDVGFKHLDAITAQPVAWIPDFEDPSGHEGSLRALAVTNSKLLLGGNFYYQVGDIYRLGYAEYLLPTATNSAPEIQAVVQSVPIQGRISILLSDIVTDAEDNIDLSTAIIISPPSSGAIAYIENGYLIIDYGQTPFSGNETLTLRICDTEDACTEQTITIESSGDITVYNAVSPNGDGRNDILFLQYIDIIPDAANNRVMIFNRWGDAVFEVTNYNNNDRVFKGLNNDGKELSTGTYFYRIEFTGGRKTQTGYLSLKR
jgi:gliding motility-associated-like protein